MRLFLIGGTGAGALLPAGAVAEQRVDTPYGPPSAPVLHFERGGTTCYFLARHGAGGTVPPHAVNYRANVWAASRFDADLVVAINAVGGITAGTEPGRVVIPDQLIDYSWGREHTFADAADTPVRHVAFTEPFDPAARGRLVDAARDAGLDALERGTYGVTQGPRLETAAEIDRLERDGCDVVGMTAMPEAGLARELDLPYAICAVVVNRAAGREGAAGIHAELAQHLAAGMGRVARLVAALAGLPRR